VRVLGLFIDWVRSGFDMNLPPKANLLVPFVKEISYPLGVFGFVIMTYLVIVGSSNAVNLTDGLDGLADHAGGDGRLGAGRVLLRDRQLGIRALPVPAAHPRLGRAADLLRVGGRRRPRLPLVQRASRRRCSWATWARWPSGGALGTIAVIVRQEIVLAIMGGIFVVEALSVMAQVIYFKYTKKRYGEGRRILLMAPLHHHFEKTGWKETQVVVRFWIITMLLCLIGLSTLKLR
jgi:phospho-N-acetylmuramoyl-pentapeptide-transferase